MNKDNLKNLIKEEIKKVVKEEMMPFGNYRDFGYESGKKDFAENKYDVVASIENLNNGPEPMTLKQTNEYFRGYTDVINVKLQVARKKVNEIQKAVHDQDYRYAKYKEGMKKNNNL